MRKNKIINLKVVAAVAQALGEINDEVIYVGGAMVSLYATDPAASEARPTSIYRYKSALTDKCCDFRKDLPQRKFILQRWKT